MAQCKGCQSEVMIKNGTMRGKMRRKCDACVYNLTEGDGRIKQSVVVKKALATILYSLGKASFGMLGKIFGVSRPLTYSWIRDEVENLPLSIVSGQIKEMEFNEMCHFWAQKNKKWIIRAVDRCERHDPATI